MLVSFHCISEISINIYFRKLTGLTLSLLAQSWRPEILSPRDLDTSDISHRVNCKTTDAENHMALVWEQQMTAPTKAQEMHEWEWPEIIQRFVLLTVSQIIWNPGCN